MAGSEQGAANGPGCTCTAVMSAGVQASKVLRVEREHCPVHGGVAATERSQELRRAAYLSYVAGFKDATPEDEYLQQANDGFDTWWRRIGKLMVRA